ncbi:MAG TPA: HAD family hydrolase, partial [Acetobacteraceae bacterium]
MGRISRRSVLVGASAMLAAAGVPVVAPRAQTGADPLPSWNDGKAKQAILDFVHATTHPSSKDLVNPEDRIATFDQDGTLWVEHPIYVQAVFALDRVRALASRHPEWQHAEPYSSVISGNMEAMAHFAESEWLKIIGPTHAGMSTERFEQIVSAWIATARNPHFNRLYTDLVYQPMREAMDLLRANGFKVYIVTGGGQEFVRTYARRVYGIPPEQVVGSSIVVKYEMRDGGPILMREPRMFFNDDNAGKAIGINLFIGKRPYAAFGNSDGDREMLEWTGAGDGPRLKMLVHHVRSCVTPRQPVPGLTHGCGLRGDGRQLPRTGFGGSRTPCSATLADP